VSEYRVTSTLNHKLNIAVYDAETVLKMINATKTLISGASIYNQYIDDEYMDKVLYSTLKGVRLTLKNINETIDEIMESEIGISDDE